MEKFFLKLRIVAEFIIVFSLTYAIFNIPLTTLPLLIVGFIDLFVLFQALGLIDKLNGYGPYAINDNNHNHYDHHYDGQHNNEDSHLTHYNNDYDEDILTNDDEDIFDT